MSARLLNDRFGDIAPDRKNVNSVLPSGQDFFIAQGVGERRKA